MPCRRSRKREARAATLSSAGGPAGGEPRRLAVSTKSSSPTRRSLLAALAAPGALSLLPTDLRAADRADVIRPFSIRVPEKGLVDLRQRIAATRWSDRE